MMDMAQPESPQEPAQEVVLSRETMLKELLDWCSNWLSKSQEWRRNSFEEQWRRWQRNSDSVYDPAIAVKKESWQSKAVWPITASHRENALANLFQTELGAKPPLEYKAKAGSPFTPQQVMPGMPAPIDQGQIIRDLVLLEREKGDYEIERNKQNEDKTTYGSGFMRARFETKLEPRVTKVPQYEPIDVFNPMSLMRHISGQAQVVGYEDQVQEVVVFRGTRCEHISIWDIFPDPKALQVRGNAIAHRYDTTYGEIVRGVAEQYYLEECIPLLKDRSSDEQTPEDKQFVESDRQIAQSDATPRPDYGRKIECFEIQARLPKKWVLIKGEAIDDPEALISARVRFKKGLCVISVQVNDSYDGEPDIEKDDYMPVAGQFYGRGIPEKLKDVHLISTETTNQRLDAGSIGLSQKFAGYSEVLVDPKDLEENRNFVRLQRPKGHDMVPPATAISRLDMGAPDKTSFIETQEWERIAQELTSVTKTTLGTENNSDTTLGGQQIQQGVTQSKMTYLAKLSEYGFQKRFSHRIWALIYQNYGPEDYAMALGMEKASQIVPMSPEQVAQNFSLVPKGVFEMENKPRRQAQKAALQQQFGMFPWWNTLGNAKSQIADTGEDEATFILPEAEAAQIMVKAQEIGSQMADKHIQQHQQIELAKKADKGAKAEK